MFLKAKIILTSSGRTNESYIPLTSVIRIYEWNGGYNIELINNKVLEAKEVSIVNGIFN
jgi:hypothetical protein